MVKKYKRFLIKQVPGRVTFVNIYNAISDTV